MLKPTPRVNPADEQGVSKLTLPVLFENEETPLLRYAYSLTGRRAVAEDIVQEVFLLLHTQWDNVHAPRAWLFRSVRNKAYSHLRDHKREVLRSDDPNDVSGARPSHDDDQPDDALLRMETVGALRNLIRELSEVDQRLVKLKYFDGLKYRDISNQTGLSVSNVGYRLHHVLKELASKLRPLGIDKIE